MILMGVLVIFGLISALPIAGGGDPLALSSVLHGGASGWQETAPDPLPPADNPDHPGHQHDLPLMDEPAGEIEEIDPGHAMLTVRPVVVPRAEARAECLGPRGCRPAATWLTPILRC